LAECLEALARDPVDIVAEELSVTPADPFVPENQAEVLRVRLRLSAWYLAARGGHS
jgi:hypothetical protein